MGTLDKNGDPKTEKGPHGDPGPQVGTHVGAVHQLVQGVPGKVLQPSGEQGWLWDWPPAVVLGGRLGAAS